MKRKTRSKIAFPFVTLHLIFFAKDLGFEFFHAKNDKANKSQSCILLSSFASLCLCENCALLIFLRKEWKGNKAQRLDLLDVFASLFFVRTI